MRACPDSPLGFPSLNVLTALPYQVVTHPTSYPLICLQIDHCAVAKGISESQHVGAYHCARNANKYPKAKQDGERRTLLLGGAGARSPLRRASAAAGSCGFWDPPRRLRSWVARRKGQRGQREQRRAESRADPLGVNLI